jgi:hypothetical protein
MKNLKTSKMKNLFLLSMVVLITPTLSAQTDTTSVNEVTMNCDWKTNEVDEFTGTTKKILNSVNFIAHTDSSLMKYYKKKPYDYLEIDCNFAKINDLYAMYFYVTIRTKKAYEYYGAIRSDAKLILMLENAGTLELKFAKSDSGDMDYDRDLTTYVSYIILEDWQMEVMDKQKIKKARVYWSKGYQDYEVDNPTIAIDQLNCLY